MRIKTQRCLATKNELMRFWKKVENTRGFNEISSCLIASSTQVSYLAPWLEHKLVTQENMGSNPIAYKVAFSFSTSFPSPFPI